jgi:hypothetical protein
MRVGSRYAWHMNDAYPIHHVACQKHLQHVMPTHAVAAGASSSPQPSILLLSFDAKASPFAAIMACISILQPLSK